MSSLRKKYQGWGHEIKNHRLFGAEPEASEVKVYYLSPEELEKYRKGVDTMPAPIPIPTREEMIELIKSCNRSISAMARAKNVGWNTIQRWLDRYDLLEEVVHTRGEASTMSIVKKLEDKYPDLESLLKSLEGKSPAQWAKENEVSNAYFYYLKKKYIKRGDQAPEQKPIKEESLKKLEEPKQLVEAREKAREKQIGETPSEEKQEPEMDEPETAPTCGALIRINTTGRVLEFANIHEALNYIENHCSKSEAQQITLYKRVPFSFGVNVVPGEVS